MFIQTEETPNPATLKFLPNRTVLNTGTANFPNAESAQDYPFVQEFFKLAHIESVFLGSDFISVTKSSQANWLTLKPSVLMIIMEYFINNDSIDIKLPVTVLNTEVTDDTENSAIIKEIREIFDTKIRPAVAQDGGDINFERFEDGVVYVTLQGACSGCPSSSATLKSGIENMLKHYLPEVESVEAI